MPEQTQAQHLKTVIANEMHSFRQFYQSYLNGIYGHGLQRDYFGTLGYYKAPNYKTYHTWYKQGGLAKTIIGLPAEDTWKRPPPITENGDESTEFVQAWNALADRLRVWSALSRADRISGIGRFGGVVIGTTLADDESTTTPLDNLSGPDDVLYLRPFWEADVMGVDFNMDRSDARYGLPEFYELRISEGESEQSETYHWTRVIHLAEGRDTSEVYGTPRLQSPLIYLVDLMKLQGGAGEAAWLNMRQGLVIKPGEGYELTVSNSDFKTDIQEYVDGMMRMIKIPYGDMDVSPVGGDNVPNVSENIDATIALIAAATRIPQRILMGSAGGQLAAAEEDTRQWAGRIAQRQKNYAEPDILRQFIDRLIGVGALPEPADGYDVGIYNETSDMWQWPSIVDMTDEQESEIVLSRARARQVLARDPLAQAWPSTRAEDRELLGLPPEPEAEVMGVNVVNQEEEDPGPEPNRDEYESELSRAVGNALSDFEGDAIEALQNGEEPDYDVLEVALIAALVAILARSARDRAEQIQAQFELFVDPATLDSEIEMWARTYAETLAPQLVDTTRDLVDQAAGAVSPEEFDQLMQRAFGEARANMISVTEITAALGMGLILLNGIYRAAHQVEADERWFTQLDERVCPICGPLHGTTRETWGGEFPDGPPAHPNCRCYLRVVKLRRLT